MTPNSFSSMRFKSLPRSVQTSSSGFGPASTRLLNSDSSREVSEPARWFVHRSLRPLKAKLVATINPTLTDPAWQTNRFGDRLGCLAVDCLNNKPNSRGFLSTLSSLSWCSSSARGIRSSTCIVIPFFKWCYISMMSELGGRNRWRAFP